ncbi:MAG: arginine--tRNA ligase [Actinomycetota bacterium]
MSSHSELLAAQISSALLRLAAKGEVVGAIPTTIPLERPKNRDHGDYASSIALAIAKSSGRAPREIAEALRGELEALPEVAKVEIAGPGFINITLNRASQADVIRQIRSQKEQYGRSNFLNGVKINLEFISANPTGPLHLGHMRWAAVGDALGRVLAAGGAQVTREFYINDHGNQMELFGKSVMAAAHGQETPEGGYHGEYINDLAREVVGEDKRILELSADEQVAEFKSRAYQIQLLQQQQVLNVFGTLFDVWFSQTSLLESGAVDRALEKLRSQGHIIEVDGATWLRHH